MTKMIKNNPLATVTEICCGIGGARKAWVDSNANVIQSIDIDKNICDFHKAVWGDSECLDITKIDLAHINSSDILSAGFPCQPFSSSGKRTGFDHKEGNVFNSLIELVDLKGFKCVFLENVLGLLSNNKGFTFKTILDELSSRFKFVEWVSLNLLDIDIPMNRPRIGICAHNFKNRIFSDIENKFYMNEQSSLFTDFGLTEELEKFTKSNKENPLSGHIKEKKYDYLNYDKHPHKFINQGNLMREIFEEDIGPFKIYSGRFWGRTGKTTFYISENQYSHSIGTSMGGAPTFAIDPKFLSKGIEEKIKSVSNYTTLHSGYYVFRLTPHDCLKFFGDKALIFYETIRDYKAPLNIKYKMIGNMFSPNQAFEYTNLIIKSHIL